jgi:phosphoglycerate kinase
LKKTISDVDPSWLRGKTAVVRVDFNVPLGPRGVTDDRRIRETIPTIELLTSAGMRVVLLSHLGRPDGEARAEFSLAPVAERLGALLARPVRFAPSPNGSVAADAVARLESGSVALLENTRYLPGEEENAPELAAFWAGLGDIFVNDAFGVAHRAHASTSGLAEAMQRRGGEAVAGLLMARELRYLQDALRDPARPFTGILGGAKISGKIGVISALLGRVDRLLIGGAMANTFFRAQGYDTGASLVEEDAIGLATELLEEGGERLLLPTDCIVADAVEAGAATRAVPTSGYPVATRSSTSAPRRGRSSASRSPGRARSSGTGPWACSRSMRSPRARSRSRGRWPRRATAARWVWSAAATRARRSIGPAWPIV